MHLPRAILPPQRPAAAGGFTLVELLITAVVGSLVIGAITTLQLSELRIATSQDLNLQLRQEANRAAAWIDSEMQRAAGFDNTAAAGCSAPSGTSLLMSMRSVTADNQSVRVSYYTPTGTAFGPVARCGPPVVCGGGGSACELSTSGSVVYLVADNARLSLATAVSSSLVRQINYTLSLQSGGVNATISRPGVAGAPTIEQGSL
jgi:Tfp pilus assembly protein PilW